MPHILSNHAVLLGAGNSQGYAAGDNINITDHVISGKDWTSEIESAVSGKQDKFTLGNNLTWYSGTVLDVNNKDCVTMPNTVALGLSASALGNYSFANGEMTFAPGDESHAEGWGTSALGSMSHSEGYETRAEGSESHAEGEQTSAYGQAAHAEGRFTSAFGDFSHAEGYQTTALGSYSYAAGNQTKAINDFSFAHGKETSAYGNGTHAEGQNTNAYADYSHAEGLATHSVGFYSHAEGDNCVAYGSASHAEGLGTVSLGANQTVIGKYNWTRPEDIFQVGNGSGNGPLQPHNALEVDSAGDLRIQCSGYGSACLNVQNNLFSLPRIHSDDLPPATYSSCNVPPWHIRKDIWVAASDTDVNNTFDLIGTDGAGELWNYMKFAKTTDRGLYRLDVDLFIKGGYSIANRYQPELMEVQPSFNYTGTYPVSGLYFGFPSSDANVQPHINHFNWSWYIDIPFGTGPDNDYVALTALKVYVPNMRWNTSNHVNSAVGNIRFVKLKEYT